MIIRKADFVLLVFFCACSSISTQNDSLSSPFPRRGNYFKGVIQAYPGAKALNDKKVIQFYTQWKQHYLRPVKGKNWWYIWKTDSLQSHTDTSCVSEGQGYGMLITVLMAGKESQSKAIFDGLFRFARAHPSDKSPYLMAWIQDSSFRSRDRSTASDGDLDIAYALLLADKQWGSRGGIDYFQEALHSIKAIRDQEINPRTYSVMLSNYSVNSGEDQTLDRFDTRSSDFMPVNFKAFAKATGDPFWNQAVNRNYRLFKNLQEKWSPDAGLVPDFILHTERGGRPSQPNYLENKNDGKYYYNACRVPWRLGLDYIVHGDPRAYTFLNKINSWIKTTTEGKPDNISAGYTLEGNDIRGQDFEALSFICPFGVSAMIDSRNQAWLNQIWDYSNHFDIHEMDYYDNTLKMMTMIIISGNYFDY
jgi:endo-1,4-beta-D-glucanase Y